MTWHAVPRRTCRCGSAAPHGSKPRAARTHSRKPTSGHVQLPAATYSRLRAPEWQITMRCSRGRSRPSRAQSVGRWCGRRPSNCARLPGGDSAARQGGLAREVGRGTGRVHPLRSAERYRFFVPPLRAARVRPSTRDCGVASAAASAGWDCALASRRPAQYRRIRSLTDFLSAAVIGFRRGLPPSAGCRVAAGAGRAARPALPRSGKARSICSRSACN